MHHARLTHTLSARDGTSIAWHAHGDPPTSAHTLLLTNGLATSARFWRHLVHAFAHDHRVVHWDYRGHGESAPATRGDYSIRTHADDLVRVTEAVIERYGGAAPIHVAFSMGVTVVLEAYRARPDLVRGLILLGGPADAPYATSLPARVPGVLRAVRSVLRASSPVAVACAPVFNKFATSRVSYPVARALGVIQPTAPREDIAEFAAGMARMDAAAFWNSMVGLMSAHASDVVPTVRVPALVIGAEHDAFVPRRDIERLASNLPGASAMIIEGAGHGVLVEAGPEVAAAIRLFLRDRFPSPAAS